MYNNIGGKIKDLAIGTFIVEAIAFVIAGFALMIDTEGLSLLLIIVGPIIAWVSSWLLYGFGEIIVVCAREGIAILVIQTKDDDH